MQASKYFDTAGWNIAMVLPKAFANFEHGDSESLNYDNIWVLERQ